MSRFAAAFLLFAGAASAAPSFDCSKAVDPVDKLVCSDEALGAADRALADQYGKLLAVAGAQKPNVVLLQRSWLKLRFKVCGPAAADTTACLRTLYDDRRKELAIGLSRQPYKSRNDEFLEWLRQQAFALLAAEPHTAEKVLRSDSSPQAEAGLALVLAMSGDARQKPEITKLTADIAARGENKDMLEDKTRYDGTLASLTPFLQAAGEVQFPCVLIERHPELIRALYSQYGSSRDNFLPYAECNERDYPVPASVKALHDALAAYDGDAFDRCTGTLRYAYSRSAYVAGISLRVIPRWSTNDTLAQEPAAEWTRLDAAPLQRWSYLGPWNRAAYFRIRTLFLTARQDLAVYYQHRFAMSADEALKAAHVALWSAEAWWTSNDHKAPPVLNVAIMEKDAKLSLAALLAAKTATATEPEPALSLALARPEAIAPLLAAHADVNATNPFGKTPLMTAAQFNNIEALRAFLKAGALVNAATLKPDAIDDNSPPKPDEQWSACGPYAIAHGSRTALMYAAANASLEVITTLVKAGADVTKRDSQGKTALDYLSGQGPVPKNPVLSPGDFDKAKRLLTP